MQIQIISTNAKNNTRLSVAARKAGEPATKYLVQAGERITLIVDGVTLTGAQPVAQQKLKLTRVGKDLVIETLDGTEKIVELTNFYTEQDVILAGEQWAVADGAQLQVLDDGVVFVPDSNASAVVAAVGLGAFAGVPAAVAAGVVAVAAAAGGGGTANPADTQGPAAVSVAVPEATGGGINAAEASDGVPVVITLPTGAAVGDVITVSIDGGTPVTYTVTANDINPTLNPGGTVSVLLPTSAITAAGQGPAVITTSYVDAAGNPAANSPVLTTGIHIDTQPPTTPTVDALATPDTTPIITGTATLLTGESLTVVVNGATYTNVTVTAGHWSIDTATAVVSSGTLGAFADGQSYNVQATVTDAAGNSSSDTSSNELRIDAFVATPSLALAHDAGGSNTDLLTSDGTINVSGLEVGATWQYSLDGGNSWLSGNGGAAATGTTGSFVATAGSYGAGRVLVKQTDVAGNISVNGELVTTTTVAQRTLHVQAGGQNDNVEITGLTDGGYVVAWRAMNESGHTQIFTQRYDSTNRAVGTKQALPTYGVSDDSVKIAATVDGGYVAVWRSDTGQPGDTDVFMQRFDANNAPVGSYTTLSVGAVTYDGFAQVVALENAGAYAGVAVAFQTASDVFVQGIDANGAVVGPPNAMSMIPSDGTYHLTALSGGGYALSGLYQNGGTQSSSVFLFDAGHTVVNHTNLGTASTQQTGITSLDDGGYVMVHSTNSGVFFSRFNAAGQMSVTSDQLRSSTGIRNASVIDLDNANGDYLVYWQEGFGAGQKVFAQRVDGTTNMATGALAENQGEATSSGIYNFNAVTLTGGSYVLAWTEYTATHDTETFFQQYDANGATTGGVQHLQGWHNAAADYLSVLTALSDGGFAISWVGHDGAASEIVTQRFDASGQLVPETLALTVDNTAPTLQRSSPADEGTVAADANISLSFSENIALGSSGHVLLKNLSGGADIDIDLANPAGQLSVVDNKLVINPGNNLTVGHSYAVHLDAGAVTDSAGNAFVGITDDTTLNFVAGPPSELYLGTVSGIDLNLIGGLTTSGGQRYYYLDLNNDGSANPSFMDRIDHDALDALFNGGADTVNTQPGGAVAGVDDARTVLVGGYTLVLPTATELSAMFPDVPSSGNQWDRWSTYWSATQTTTESHMYVNPFGFSGADVDANAGFVVAIQVIL